MVAGFFGISYLMAEIVFIWWLGFWYFVAFLLNVTAELFILYD